MTIHTTLNAIRDGSPCKDGWEKLLASLGKTKADDAPLALTRILESNGIQDAIWCLRVLPKEHEKNSRLYACDVAEHVLHLFELTRPDDNRPRTAIETSRRYAIGKVTREELEAARDAAWYAAEAAAWAAAWDAARAAAWDAAWYAAEAASRSAAEAAERKYQAELFIKYFG